MSYPSLDEKKEKKRKFKLLQVARRGIILVILDEGPSCCRLISGVYLDIVHPYVSVHTKTSESFEQQWNFQAQNLRNYACTTSNQSYIFQIISFPVLYMPLVSYFILQSWLRCGFHVATCACNTGLSDGLLRVKRLSLMRDFQKITC